MSGSVAASLGIRDRRSARTRTLIFSAFRELIFARPYDELSVADIVGRADIGRSTFYEHFENKEDVLRQSLEPVLRPLVDAIAEAQPLDDLARVLEHFLQVRELSLLLLNGSLRSVTVRYHADVLESRLVQRRDACRGSTEILVPPALIAASIADAQFGLLSAWLLGRATCAPRAVAAALRGVSQTTVRWWLAGSR